MFGPSNGGRPIVVMIVVAAMGLLATEFGANAATKVMRTPDGDTCAQADSVAQQGLSAVIAACDVVVTQAQGANLGRFYRYRGRALERAGQLARALPDYDQALAILPNDEWSLKWRASVREALGDNAGAIDDYRRLDILQPNFSDWRRAIVRLGGKAESPPKKEMAADSPPAASKEASPPPGKPPQPESRTALQSRQEGPPVDNGAEQEAADSKAYQAQLRELGFFEDRDLETQAAEQRRQQEVERFELVRRAQTELTRLGYAIGEIDGIAGRRTRDALKDWLQRNGHPTNREIDPQLVAGLEQAQPPAPQAPPQQVAGAETKSLEPEARDSVTPTLAPEKPANAPVQVLPQGPVIAATGQQARDSTTDVPDHPKPQTASPVLPPADGDRRVALVIGNSNYQNVTPLRNPRQDAEDMAIALQAIGFEVIPGYDLDRKGMEEITKKFARQAAKADTALTYYSGHAMQSGGSNLLVPVDGRLEDEFDLRDLLRLDQVIQDTGRAHKLGVVIVDACRDDPLRGRQNGLAQPGVQPANTVIAYAAAPGSVAYDGNGRNSPYVTALLRHLNTPGTKVLDMFAAVTGDVARKTRNAQRPGIFASLDADAVYLVPEVPRANGVELSELTRGEVHAIGQSLSWLGFWSGSSDGTVSPALLDALHLWQRSQSGEVTDVVSTAEIVALHRRAARERPREPLPPIGNVSELQWQATQQDATAQRLLGMVSDPSFEAGPFPKDQEWARRWYESAAKAGDAEAAARLGLMLASPRAPTADQREAREWLAKAADAGDPAASLRLAELLLDEGKDSPARPQAIELLKVAAAKPETEGFANALLRDLGYQVVLSSNL